MSDAAASYVVCFRIGSQRQHGSAVFGLVNAAVKTGLHISLRMRIALNMFSHFQRESLDGNLVRYVSCEKLVHPCATPWDAHCRCRIQMQDSNISMPSDGIRTCVQPSSHRYSEQPPIVSGCQRSSIGLATRFVPGLAIHLCRRLPIHSFFSRPVVELTRCSLAT